jgi:hypothetical protein
MQYSNTTYVVQTIIWAYVKTVHESLINSIDHLRILLNSDSELRIIYRELTMRYANVVQRGCRYVKN